MLRRGGGAGSGRSPTDNSDWVAISRAKVIERLIDADSCQAGTQTESGDFCIPDKGDCSGSELLPSSSESELPFLGAETEETDICHRVRAMDRSKKAGPALQSLIDLSNVDIANEQDAGPNIGVIKEILLNSPERPTWDSVHTESAEIKNLRSQYNNLKIQDAALLRRCKNQGLNDGWQIVAPQSIRTHIFQACHHRKLAAHQAIIRTLSWIKRWFHWPNMHRDIESWC